MQDPQVPTASLKPTKEMVEVNGKEIAYPGKGTAARYVWDLADYAVANGQSSSDVIDTVIANTSMSRASANSQLTYWRKATGQELSRRVDTSKAEEKAAKKLERESKRAERLAANAGKRGETIAKLEEQIGKLSIRLSTLKAEEAEANEEAPTEAPAGEDEQHDAA